ALRSAYRAAPAAPEECPDNKPAGKGRAVSAAATTRDRAYRLCFRRIVPKEREATEPGPADFPDRLQEYPDRYSPPAPVRSTADNAPPFPAPAGWPPGTIS